MGVIKDGSISGVLPDKKAFLVHYPGYPSSTERALETLGGTDGIAKMRSLQSNKLKLHFRPEDPYSHPAIGERIPCSNFILKISKEKSNEPHENAQVGDEQQLCADVIASVSEAYHFNGMVDYQHVPAVHADMARKRKSNWADLDPQLDNHGLMDVDQEDLMLLLPPFFSTKDRPEKVVLKPSIDMSMKKKQQGAVRQIWEKDIDHSLGVDFYIKDVPKPFSWEKYIPEGSEQYEWQVDVRKLFDEKPVWAKRALIERLLDKGFNFGECMLRRLLFRVAYYFSNGPFLRFWIRKGYDPRKDPESRIYQRIDFRVKPHLRNYERVKNRWDDLCAFKVFPHKFQTSLQLFELKDEYIQQEIRKPPNQSACRCATGWFSAHVLDTLRLYVAVKFLSVYPDPGDKSSSLLKLTSERFEKAKRTPFFAKNQKPDEDQQQPNKESAVNEEPDDNDDNIEEDEEEEEEEEDEIEDDYAAAEYNAYEEHDMGGDDGSFSNTGSRNISRNYLQDLFGSFPFNSDRGEAAAEDADTNDGEYEIYEQDNENYSDMDNDDDDDDDDEY